MQVGKQGFFVWVVLPVGLDGNYAWGGHDLSLSPTSLNAIARGIDTDVERDRALWNWAGHAWQLSFPPSP